MIPLHDDWPDSGFEPPWFEWLVVAALVGTVLWLWLTI